MQGSGAAVAANNAFYKAFQQRDVTAMAEIWSRVHPVTCIHPGWRPLFGRDAVLNSWRSILTGDSPPDIACVRPHAWIHGGIAYVLCFEVLEAVSLAATNIFVQEPGGWKMVHHQAGASPSPADTAEPDGPPTMQ